MASRQPANSFIVTCLDDEPCFVSFEPWGSEYLLESGDFLRIETRAFKTGNLEVSYGRGRILIAFMAPPDPKITNRAGDAVPI
jgi:hypothetical protein